MAARLTPDAQSLGLTVALKLREFATLWASRSEDQRAEMIRAVYARVEVDQHRTAGDGTLPAPG